MSKRIETGTVRFGSDWTCVVIRGDNAFAYGMALKNALDDPEAIKADPLGTRLLLEDLAATLAASREGVEGHDGSAVQVLRPFHECLAVPDEQDSDGFPLKDDQ